jgi:hypothetical protein
MIHQAVRIALGFTAIAVTFLVIWGIAQMILLHHERLAVAWIIAGSWCVGTAILPEKRKSK